MAFNLTRGIFGVLENSPNESASAERIAEALDWQLPAIERKLKELAGHGYLTRNGNIYTLSHELD